LRNYELVFIASPDLDDEGVETTINKYTDVIDNQGGELVKIDKMGKRRLAYEIKDFKEGFYVVVYLKGGSDVINELDRVLKIDDNIIRHIIIRHDEKHQKTNKESA